MSTFLDQQNSNLTVGQAAEVLGVTVRTLHHWDSEGIAGPSHRSGNGYRLYTAADLHRLRRVLLYRELGLSLNEIKDLLETSSEPRTSLRQQRDLIKERIRHLEDLIGGLDRMIDAHENGLLLSAQQQSEIFGVHWDPAWVRQAQQQWGDTQQWREYAELSSARSPEDWVAITAATNRIEQLLAEAKQQGIDPTSEKAVALAEEHRHAFSSYFPITHDMHVCLGRMYEQAPDFAAHYNDLQPGLATWLRRAIEANAERHGVDPQTCTWQ